MGRCAVGIESTIVDLSRDGASPRLLRPGHVTPEQIASVIGVMPELPGAQAGAVPRVSGSLDGHYAPRTPMRQVSGDELASLVGELQRAGQRCGVLAHCAPAAALAPQAYRQLPGDAPGYARGLYAALRELDQADIDLIVVEAIPATAAWAAVADRLRRSVCGSGEG